VYLNDNRVADDFMFQSATPFALVAAGTHTLHITAANAPDNSTPLASVPVTFNRGDHYQVIASGQIDPTKPNAYNLSMRGSARMTSVAENTVDFYIVHGAADLGMVDVRTLDPMDNTRGLALWGNNLEFGDMTSYQTVKPAAYNVEISTSNNDMQYEVFRFDLNESSGDAMVLALSGAGMSSAEGLTMMGVMNDGKVFFPQVITATEGTELPTEFALLGNYPNPFNPSTRIQFDLPETAQVTVAVFDVLGREVMVLPAQEVEAGVNRSLELNAARLASGNYFYQVVATSASGRHVQTGRMMLIK